jgi:hypothetical protein
MGAWWRLRQWVYARPRVAVAGVVVSLLAVAFGGWESARWVRVAQEADSTLYRTESIRTLTDAHTNERVIDQVIVRTRTVRGPIQDRTVVITKSVTRTVSAQIRRGGGAVGTRSGRIRTVTTIQTRTLERTHTVAQLVTTTLLATETQPAQQIPPGHVRPTTTVTVTQTRTVTSPPMTITVTTTKGH